MHVFMRNVLPYIRDFCPDGVEDDVDVFVDVFFEELEFVNVEVDVDDGCDCNECSDEVGPDIDEFVVFMEETFEVEDEGVVVDAVSFDYELVVDEHVGQVSAGTNKVFHETLVVLALVWAVIFIIVVRE